MRVAKVERLKEDIAELGMPVITVSSGVSLKPKECFINDLGFHFPSGNLYGCIRTDTDELIIKDKPDCHRCYDVRRIRDGIVLAEIFWPK